MEFYQPRIFLDTTRVMGVSTLSSESLCYTLREYSLKKFSSEILQITTTRLETLRSAFTLGISSSKFYAYGVMFVRVAKL